jgi:hypothetical protein
MLWLGRFFVPVGVAMCAVAKSGILVLLNALLRSCEDRCDKLRSQMGDDAIFASRSAAPCAALEILFWRVRCEGSLELLIYMYTRWRR